MPGRLTRRTIVERGSKSLLRDRGYIQKHVSGPTNAYFNEDAGEQYTNGPSIPLTYAVGQQQEAGATMLEVTTSDAEVYLPLDVTATSIDRVVITHRNGRRLDPPIICALQGDPLRQVAIQIVKVQTVVETT